MLYRKTKSLYMFLFNFKYLQKSIKKGHCLGRAEIAILSAFFFSGSAGGAICESPEEGSKARSIPSLSRVFLSGSAAPGRAHPSAHRVCAVGACLFVFSGATLGAI